MGGRMQEYWCFFHQQKAKGGRKSQSLTEAKPDGKLIITKVKPMQLKSFDVMSMFKTDQRESQASQGWVFAKICSCWT